jgi:hypothetical protein
MASHIAHEDGATQVHSFATGAAALSAGCEPAEFGYATHQIYVDGIGVAVGAGFVKAMRARNVALMFCIKY